MRKKLIKLLQNVDAEKEEVDTEDIEELLHVAM